MVSQYNLFIKTTSETSTSFYQNHECYHAGDSGFDLTVPDDVTFNLWETKLVDFHIQCEVQDQNKKNVSYYLYPRSSISKTPLRLANSVGIIDAGYRGNIKAALQFFPDGSDNTTFVLKKGTRLMQLCTSTLEPFNSFQLVDTLSDTTRGTGGFGSTGCVNK
jgi:dUTP pyrophosphatase